VSKKESMESIFESWELILFARVEALETLIDRIQTDFALAGYKRDKGLEYIEHHIADMRDQVREKLQNNRRRLHAG